MKFDPYAFLSAAGNETPDGATRATCATPPPEMSPRVAQVARVARVEPSKSETQRPAEPPYAPEPSLQAPGGDPYPYGVACGGRPLTWTGRVVSLDEWKRLTGWERHGSTGKVWNGLTRQWEPMGGGADEA